SEGDTAAPDHAVRRLALLGPRKSSSGNRSRFFGSGRVLSGRFGIDARSRRGLVALGSLGSYPAFRADLLHVLSKFDSAPPPSYHSAWFALAQLNDGSTAGR